MDSATYVSNNELSYVALALNMFHIESCLKYTYVSDSAYESFDV